MRLACVVVLVGISAAGVWPARASTSAPPFVDGFEGYSNGAVLAAVGTNGWSASDNGAVVSGNAVLAQAGTNYLAISSGTTVSNTISGLALTPVWVDFWTKPTFGTHLAEAPPAGVNLYAAFGTDGWLAINSNGVWDVCSSDIQGAPTPVVTTSAWQRVTVYCDYGHSNAAVLVNGQVLRQRLTLSGQRPAMTNVVWDSTTDGASLDEVRITTNVPPGLTSNLNQNAMNDADELQTYGYCARILAVGAGQTYTSLTGAVANARDRDILRVAAGAYTGDVTVACSLFFVGEAFTIQGNLNVSDGLTVQATNAITCSGSVTLNTNSMLIVSNGALAASTLGIATGATVRIVNGTLAADGTALTTGTYTLDYRWGTFVTQTLPFADTFEAYSAGQAVSALGWFGWSVGGVGAEVEATNTYTNLSTRAVAMPSGSAVYVTIDPGSQEKVWSDVWVQPVLGDEPVGSGASLLMYFNADGYLVVSNAAVVGGWDVCTNDFFGASVAPVVVGDWVRLTVRQDYASPQNGAIFLRGRLLRQQLGFFGAPPHFSKIRVGDASVGVTFMDDISVSTNMPVAMPWSDGDGDGTQDAQEIDRRGDVRLFPHGTVFKFR